MFYSNERTEYLRVCDSCHKAAVFYTFEITAANPWRKVGYHSEWHDEGHCEKCGAEIDRAKVISRTR